MRMTLDGNMASARVGKLWLGAAGRHAIKDETWRQYLDHAAASTASDGPFHGVLFWSPTHGPSASQRKVLRNEFARAIAVDAQRRVVLISESTLVRGAMTAISWFARTNAAAFSPADIQCAFDWLAEDIPFDRTQAQRALVQIVDAVQVQPRLTAPS
jgi:hypothetical protein